MTPPTAPERCTVCDRPLAVGGCPRFRASSATSWTAHEWKSAAFDCHAHRVDWRARAIRRGVLAAQVRRHPRAASFRSLVDALVSGRASRAQLGLARTLAAEVAA